MTFSTQLTQDILDNLVGHPVEQVSLHSGDGGGGLWLGLSTGHPGEEGSLISEPGVNLGYQRIFVGTLRWNHASAEQPSVVDNRQTENFATATGGGWGTLKYLTLHNGGPNPGDASYLGNGQINGANGITVSVNDVASFASGAADITLL
jgi:hypothetical protein